MKHLIHVLCQTFAYKNWLLYLIVLTPHTVSLHVMSIFYPHFEVDQIIHGRMPPKAQQVTDEILMDAFISVTSLSYTDESIHQTRAVRGFFSSPIMQFTSSHVSIPCRTMLFRLHCYQLSSSKFSASNMRLYLKFMYFWVADWVEWFENVCVGPVRKDWFGNTYCTFCYF